jgi:hypothetical protein
MLIDRRCRLCAAVAISAVEIEGGDAMLAVSAFECGAAIHRFGCVISHIFNPATYLGLRSNSCAILEQENCRWRGVANPISALGIDTVAKVSFGSQSSDLFFVGYHCDISVQISRRRKYKWREIHEMPFEQVLRLLCIANLS